MDRVLRSPSDHYPDVLDGGGLSCTERGQGEGAWAHQAEVAKLAGVIGQQSAGEAPTAGQAGERALGRLPRYIKVRLDVGDDGGGQVPPVEAGGASTADAEAKPGSTDR